MPSVAQHYKNHLAPVYMWMVGGADAAIARGQAEMEAVCPHPSKNRVALDLGAGFGMHAIPLANMGYSVVAIDSSEELLGALRSYAGGRSIKIINADLMRFGEHAEAPVALIVCLGDTLTHLPDRQSVERLFDDAAMALEEGGRFIITFRDYSTPLAGPARFIAVRSDEDRILTCFLEYDDETVTVHDLLHQRDGTGWRQRISAYKKLRLSTTWLVGALESRGFQVRHEAGLAGMTRIIAQRAA
jgi:SAM-dependent methyltransferase